MCELLHTSRGHDPAYSQLLLYGNPPGGRRAEGLVQRAAPGVEAPSASCPRELHPKKKAACRRVTFGHLMSAFSTIVPKRGTGLRIGKGTLSLMQRRLV